jgi:hypothetical protein
VKKLLMALVAIGTLGLGACLEGENVALPPKIVEATTSKDFVIQRQMTAPAGEFKLYVVLDKTTNKTLYVCTGRCSVTTADDDE